MADESATPGPDYDSMIREAEERLGVTVLPFQREWIKAYLSGSRVLISAPRRAGWTTARQIAEALRSHRQEPAS